MNSPSSTPLWSVDVRRELVILALVASVLAQPWAVPGFEAIYSYHVSATGLLALKGKQIDGTVTYKFLNITDGYIKMNVTMNLTVKFLNGATKKLVKSTVAKVSINTSSVFLTEQALKNLKKSANVTCTNATCMTKIEISRTLNTGIKVSMKGYSIFDLKAMLLKESESTMRIYANNGRPLGVLKTKMVLIKTVLPQGGNAR